ncbi:MAG: NADH-quinone oxidoreductase subunit N [Deltaproteobacteria bacterium]|nr:NADH-quinone oxidoreductase subunit N [Deltaproteobacteria bacterium]
MIYLPLIVIAACAFGILLCEGWRLQKNVSFFLGLLALIASLALLLNQEIQPHLTFFSHSLKLDGIWYVSTFFLIIISIFIFLLSHASLKPTKKEYFFFVLIALLGMSLISASNHLLMIFLSLELFSLCLYVLVTYNVSDVRANEAAMKYFILGAFAAGFFVFGTALIYAVSGSFVLSDIGEVILAPSGYHPYLLMGVSLLFVSLAFKVAAVPFHMWVPDAYEGAPSVVTSFMATAVKIAAFSVLFRLFLTCFLPLKTYWHTSFFVLCIATMVVGNVAALMQENLKRMLAYSAIAHSGYLLIAFISFQNISDLAPLHAFWFYLAVYSVMNLGAFGVLAATGYETLKDFQGFGYRSAVLALLFSVFLMSLAGIPPTAGFLSKFYLFSAAIASKQYILVVIALINAFISVYYYLKVLIAMYMSESIGGEKVSISLPAQVTLGVMFALTIYLGLQPGILNDFIQNAMRGVF